MRHLFFAGLLVGACVTPPPTGEDAGSLDGADGGVDAGVTVLPDAGPACGIDGGCGIVVFSRTAGFRHDSIAAGTAALEAIGRDAGWPMVATEDEAALIDQLPHARAVVFLLTSGDVLTDAGEAALESFVRGGGGFVGIHSASDTEYQWPFYQQLVGEWFSGHPAIQEATVRIEEAAFAPGAPSTWQRVDEWYNFRSNPRPRVQVVLTVDESTYDGGTHGADHPIAWRREVDAGRAFYTAMGHTAESYAEPLFIAHLTSALWWAARR